MRGWAIPIHGRRFGEVFARLGHAELGEEARA